MAKDTSSNSRTFTRKIKRKRPGIHSKNKAGRNKGSKNYLKKYKGQGR
jgi:hypothetical protein